MVEGEPGTPLRIGVPDLYQYEPASGIGRVLWSIAEHLPGSIELVNARYVTLPVPAMRNLPMAVGAPPGVDLLLHPRILGAQALGRTRGLPSIAIVHDIGILDFPGDTTDLDRFTRYTIRLGANGLRHATGIVSVSRFTTDRLVSHMPDLEPRITTIPDGVSSTFLDYNGSKEAARSLISKEAGVAAGCPLLVYVGSELPRKNVPTLLRAFRQVMDIWPTAMLLKVGRAGGEGYREKTLETARDLGLQAGEDVIFLENVTDATLAHAYNAADVMVTASVYEGFGLPALEAMAVGVPIVVTCCGALPEVAGDVGRVAQPTPVSLADAIVQSIQDPSKIDRLQRGRERARSYSWAASAERYMELFRSVTLQGGQGAGRPHRRRGTWLPG